MKSICVEHHMVPKHSQTSILKPQYSCQQPRPRTPETSLCFKNRYLHHTFDYFASKHTVSIPPCYDYCSVGHFCGAFWFVHLARRISLCGPLNSKVCFDRQNISSTKIRTDLRKSTPTRKTSKTQKQISQTFEADSSSFWVGQAKKLSTKVLLTERSLSLPYRKPWHT